MRFESIVKHPIGNRGRRSKHYLRISRYFDAKRGSWKLSLSISAKCMKDMRWVIGDKLSPIELSEDGNVIRFRRVAQTGFAISGKDNKERPQGYVQMTIDPAKLEQVFQHYKTFVVSKELTEEDAGYLYVQFRNGEWVE